MLCTRSRVFSTYPARLSTCRFGRQINVPAWSPAGEGEEAGGSDSAAVRRPGGSGSERVGRTGRACSHAADCGRVEKGPRARRGGQSWAKLHRSGGRTTPPPTVRAHARSLYHHRGGRVDDRGRARSRLVDYPPASAARGPAIPMTRTVDRARRTLWSARSHAPARSCGVSAESAPARSSRGPCGRPRAHEPVPRGCPHAPLPGQSFHLPADAVVLPVVAGAAPHGAVGAVEEDGVDGPGGAHRGLEGVAEGGEGLAGDVG